MACNIDEEIPKFKHYCRVCKKGFMCGRALGGHMRAHGIGDIDNGILDDEDDDNDSSNSEEKYGGSDFGTGIKRMYKLRTNPNRLKSCRNCEHCGKEFFSWKSFLEHGKCGSNDTSESLVSSPSESAGEYYGGRKVGGWSKRKRSFRANVGSINSTSLSSEEEDLHLARCLIQLSNTKVDSLVVAEPEESCASASREEMEERRNPRTLFGITTSRPHLDNKAKGHITPSPKGLFECTTCKKVFNSHQALGGHRASHKKVKGCYAAKLEQQQLDETSLADDNVITREEFLTSSKYYQYEQAPTLVGAAKRKSKVHECSICHKVFSTGQALGGHKRFHWITSNSPDTSSLAKFQFQDKNTYQSIQTHPKTNIRQSDTLDLNSFPLWTEDMSRIKRNQHNPFSFEVSTDMHLNTWTGRESSTPSESQLQYHNRKNDNGVTNENNIINLDSDMKIVENDEADNVLKYAAKLSNLKDLKDDKDNSSQWLQVGVGSTTEASVDI